MEDLFISIAEGNLDPKYVLKTLYQEEKSDEFIGSVIKKHSGAENEKHYQVLIKVVIWDRTGTLHKVLGVLAKNSINLIRITTKSHPEKHTYTAWLRLEVNSFDQISRVFEDWEELDCVVNVALGFSNVTKGP